MNFPKNLQIIFIILFLDGFFAYLNQSDFNVGLKHVGVINMGKG